MGTFLPFRVYNTDNQLIIHSFIEISLKALPFLYAISIFLKTFENNNCIHFSEMSLR